VGDAEAKIIGEASDLRSVNTPPHKISSLTLYIALAGVLAFGLTLATMLWAAVRCLGLNIVAHDLPNRQRIHKVDLSSQPAACATSSKAVGRRASSRQGRGKHVKLRNVDEGEDLEEELETEIEAEHDEEVMQEAEIDQSVVQEATADVEVMQRGEEKREEVQPAATMVLVQADEIAACP